MNNDKRETTTMTTFTYDQGMIPNPSVEAWVSSFDVKEAALVRMPLDKINTKAGRENQARLVSVDRALAARYAEALAAGAVFPPVVLCDTRAGLIPADGNHRIIAHQTCERYEIDAYVLRTTEAVRSIMTLTANNMNGLPPSDEERRMHAIHLSTYGLNHRQIALHTGLPRSTVGDILAAENVKVRADRHRTKVPPKHLHTISRVKSGPAAAAVIDATEQAGASLDQVRELVEAVLSLNSEGEQIAEVDRFVSMWEREAAALKRPKATKASSEAAKCLRTVGSVLALRPELIGQHLTGDTDQMRSRVLDAAAHLKRIGDAL